MIVAGVDLNVADPEGWTALILAAQNGHAEVAQALIAAGADLSVANQKGSTR